MSFLHKTMTMIGMRERMNVHSVYYVIYLVDIWHHSSSVSQCVLLLHIVVDQLKGYIYIS